MALAGFLRGRRRGLRHGVALFGETAEAGELLLAEFGDAEAQIVHGRLSLDGGCEHLEHPERGDANEHREHNPDWTGKNVHKERIGP